MWQFPKVVAHRGGGKLAPENTLAAMRCGLAYGFKAVEFDVMLTQDEVPVLMHDPDFGRTIKETAGGTGSVATTLASSLTQMDAGSWFSAEFAGERVPLLWDVLQFCREQQIWMNIEIKPSPGTAERTGAVVAQMVLDFYRQYPVPASLMPLFSSFELEALAQAQRVAPEIARAALFERVPPDWQQRLQELGAVALHTNHKVLTPELAHSIKQAGYGLFCYTVNDAARAREIVGWGVDAFCTDRIDLIGADFLA
ncbi:MAG: glycerophosphodiester phosphodiesterase [Burkholderiales bacterium]|nr:glycerophosphodiester phosphodiesterase [Burkholderiales bacterium]